MTILKWRLKGPHRDEWFVTARKKMSGEKDAEGHYETRWDVTVNTAPAQASYSIRFDMLLSMDEHPSLIQVWRELNEHFAQMTMAAIGYRGCSSDEF